MASRIMEGYIYVSRFYYCRKAYKTNERIIVGYDIHLLRFQYYGISSFSGKERWKWRESWGKYLPFLKLPLSVKITLITGASAVFQLKTCLTKVGLFLLVTTWLQYRNTDTTSHTINPVRASQNYKLYGKIRVNQTVRCILRFLLDQSTVYKVKLT